MQLHSRKKKGTRSTASTKSANRDKKSESSNSSREFTTIGDRRIQSRSLSGRTKSSVRRERGSELTDWIINLQISQSEFSLPLLYKLMKTTWKKKKNQTKKESNQPSLFSSVYSLTIFHFLQITCLVLIASKYPSTNSLKMISYLPHPMCCTSINQLEYILICTNKWS